MKTKRVKDEAIDFSTVEREDSSMLEGKTDTVRSGKAGVRDVTYRQTFRNGELVTTKVLRQEVLREPVDAIVAVGTKEPAPEPAPEPVATTATTPPAAPSGTSSRSASPAATGPSTPATATTAGCSSTSARGSRTAAPGYPHEASRETQIAIAEKVRAATGGYGSWPACSASLGLPQ